MDATPPTGISAPFGPVQAPDEGSQIRMAELLASTPRGRSYGRLAAVGVLAAGWHGEVPPRPITQARVVVFAGDHGIAERGISAYSAGASIQQAAEIQAGGGAVQSMARASDATVRLVDVSLDHEAWGEERVSRSSGAIDVEDAMDAGQLERALEIGRKVADQEIDAGADLLVPGDLGVGNTTVAAALMGMYTRTEPVAVVGPGSGADDEMWKRKVAIIRDAMFRVRHLRAEPLEVLRKIGSPDIAALVGFIGQAVSRRTPVLLDGAPVTVAGYLVQRLADGAAQWFIAGQLTPEPAHLLALQKMDLTPLLALEMTTGQGVGALAALPLITSAIELAGDEAALQSGGDKE